jgi:hypothetical protein
MNPIELQLLDILHRGRDRFGFISVRGEFEAEGARRDELLRLIEIGYKADLDLVIKIGGCEAVRDLYEAKQLGASSLIAPMIETPYALRKYISAINKCFTEEEQRVRKFFFNIETITAFQFQEELISLSQQSNLAGIVFGRVDFVCSLGLLRQAVNTRSVTDKVVQTAQLCRNFNQEFILGGGIDPEALATIDYIQSIYLTGYETRKIAFLPLDLPLNQRIQGLVLAAEFELLWLKNKQNYYLSLQQEDSTRIALLERRVAQLRAA